MVQENMMAEIAGYLGVTFPQNDTMVSITQKIYDQTPCVTYHKNCLTRGYKIQQTMSRYDRRQEQSIIAQ